MTRNERIIEKLKELYAHEQTRPIAYSRIFWEKRDRLESELASIESEEEENNCDHEHTETKGIRCNVCADCGEVLEIDI